MRRGLLYAQTEVIWTLPSCFGVLRCSNTLCSGIKHTLRGCKVLTSLIPLRLIRRLQLVQNLVATLITGCEGEVQESELSVVIEAVIEGEVE